jgi:hypothetical protein
MVTGNRLCVCPRAIEYFNHARVFNSSTDMRFIFTGLFILIFSLPAFGQQDTGSGMDFLNIAPSPHQLSLSEATSATLTGSSAIYSNPALLVMEPQSSVEANYTLWIADVNNQYASVNFLSDNYALGFGIYNSRSTEFEARGEPGPSQGNFSISYLSLSASGAYQLGPFSAGITAHYLREEVFQLRANGYAVSAGIAGEFLYDRLRVGAAIQNLGEMDELDQVATSLPSTIRAGATVDVIEFSTPGRNDLPILLSLHSEWIHPLEDLPGPDYTDQDTNNDFFVMALSADIAELVELRGGYKFGQTERPVSLGLGMTIEPVTVNYAMVPFSTGFGMVHSIGVQFYF